MEQWPIGQSAAFQIHGYQVQNHLVAPKPTQPFIRPSSIKWVPRPYGDLVVKENCLLVGALYSWDSSTRSIKKGQKVFFSKMWWQLFRGLRKLTRWLVWSEANPTKRSFDAWGPLKGHTYLNKHTCKFQDFLIIYDLLVDTKHWRVKIQSNRLIEKN